MTKDVNILMCNTQLKIARDDARSLKVKVPKMRTWSMPGRGYRWHEVWSGGSVVHQGYYYCASEIKAAYIDRLITKATQGAARRYGECPACGAGTTITGACIVPCGE